VENKMLPRVLGFSHNPLDKFSVAAMILRRGFSVKFADVCVYAVPPVHDLPACIEQSGRTNQRQRQIPTHQSSVIFACFVFAS
jgi:hypothetical protein